MTVDTKVFTYDELVVWFKMLSKLSDCRGLAVCAEEYAHRLVVEDEMDQGRYWLKAEKVYWSFIKQPHYQMMMEFGLEREVQLPFIGTPVEQIPVRPFATGASSLHHHHTDILFLQRHQCQRGPVVFRLLWQASLCDGQVN